jgi:hypothetical protein
MGHVGGVKICIALPFKPKTMTDPQIIIPLDEYQSLMRTRDEIVEAFKKGTPLLQCDIHVHGHGGYPQHEFMLVNVPDSVTGLLSINKTLIAERQAQGCEIVALTTEVARKVDSWYRVGFWALATVAVVRVIVIILT